MSDIPRSAIPTGDPLSATESSIGPGRFRLPRLLLRTFPLQTGQVLLLSLLAGGLHAALIMLITYGVEENRAERATDFLDLLSLISLWIVFCFAKQQALARAVGLTEGLATRLGLGLSERVRRSGLAGLEAIGEGRIFAAVSRDLRTVGSAGMVAVHALQSTLVILGCLLALFYYSPVAAVLIVEILALGRLAFYFTDRELRASSAAANTAEDRFFDLSTHLLDGFKELKLNAGRSRALFEDYLAPAARESRAARIAAGGYHVRKMSLFNWLFFPTLAGIAFVLPQFGVHGFATAAVVVVALWMPAVDVISAYPYLVDMDLALTRLRSLDEDLDHQADAHAAGQFAPARLERLELRGVSFAYTDPRGEESFRLGPLDLSLQAGEIVLLAGPNGSGKTTLLKLLCGLYPPLAGEIRVNSAPLAPEDYRGLFATVLGDFHLFQRLYGLGAVPDSLTAHWLARLDLGDKTAVEDGAFTTTALSTGQRKRLALMVACLEERPVLVFDEWSADQDPPHRHWFYREFLPELRRQGKLVICASHDDRYFDAADRVLRLQDGQWRDQVR